MAPIDPELRMRQLAELRAAYDASPCPTVDHSETRIARHSRVLLGRILVVLSDPDGGAGARETRPGGKACADL
ncbi:hypothetical protein MKK63_02485 [Methylobacterium sp. J-088]|uniref:hypothetical protein n=1 Tax=unclassified Methylobacterium TaxID=2615210 RepID=UPI001FB88E12|nr:MULTISPECIES: hypothetical protein [unclassified Methylobacterium]MCJ2061581.1 hypothetical protein [Methylobacterium sp. J-088]